MIIMVVRTYASTQTYTHVGCIFLLKVTLKSPYSLKLIAYGVSERAVRRA